MRQLISAVSTLPLLAVTALLVAGPATAAHVGNVYTMTNSTDATLGNEVVVYNRFADGSLKFNMSRATGGAGSGPAPTSTVFGPLIPATADGLGSQNGIIINDKGTKLFAVNAGSDSVTCFPIETDGGLGTPKIADSGGVFPASVAVHFKHLAVLNSGNVGNITTFRIEPDCELERLPGGLSLAGFGNDVPFLDPAPNEVLTTAAQVSFTPDGSRLVFSLKGGPPNFGGAIGIVDVGKKGRLMTSSLVVTEGAIFNGGNGTAGPFGFDFDSNGNLVLMQTNSFTMSSYAINDDNTLSAIGGPLQISATAGGPVLGNPGFPCWVSIARGAAPNGDDIAYAINFGDIPATNGFTAPDGPGAIVAVEIDSAGNLSLLPYNG